MKRKLHRFGDDIFHPKGICSVAAIVAAGSAVVGAAASNSAANKAKKAQDSATAVQAQQQKIAQEQWDTYKETYQPLEKGMVAEAQNFDSPENRERAAGLASATVATQYGKARDRLGRTPGLDPSSGAYAAAITGLERDQAAADAVGQNAARGRVTDQAWDRKMGALSLGKGLASQAQQGFNAAGQQAAGLANMQSNSAANTAQNVGKLFSNGLDLYNKLKSPAAAAPAYDNGGTVDNTLF